MDGRNHVEVDGLLPRRRRAAGNRPSVSQVGRNFPCGLSRIMHVQVDGRGGRGGGETCSEMPAVGRWLDGGAEDCSPSICEDGLGVQ